MRQVIQNRQRTGYVKIDSHRCKACWKCMDVCPANVLGKVDILWHKHVKITNGGNCTGCLKCVKACGFDAILKLPKKHMA